MFSRHRSHRARNRSSRKRRYMRNRWLRLEPLEPRQMLTVAPFQNPVEPLDVNDDGLIEALDALLISNATSAQGGDFEASLLQGVTPIEYLDVDGDDWVTDYDLDAVTDYLNFQPDPPVIHTVTGPSEVYEQEYFSVTLTTSNVSSVEVESLDDSFASVGVFVEDPEDTWTWEEFAYDDNPSGTAIDPATIVFNVTGQRPLEPPVGNT